jgi:hypothetical protein
MNTSIEALRRSLATCDVPQQYKHAIIDAFAAELGAAVQQEPTGMPPESSYTGDWIAAAEKRAEDYNGDSRRGIKADVINAWHAGAHWMYLEACRLAASPVPASTGLTERTPKNYAIEHAEYMAMAGERLLEAIDARDALLIRREESDDVPECDVFDAASTVGSRIATLKHCTYEFRKRRDRALLAAAQPVHPEAARAQGGGAVREAYKPAGEPMETWNTPMYDLQTRLEICAGAVDFERKVAANLRGQLAALSAPELKPVEEQQVVKDAKHLKSLYVLEVGGKFHAHYVANAYAGAEWLRTEYQNRTPRKDWESLRIVQLIDAAIAAQAGRDAG